jgi:hypothetical protein
MPRPFHEHPHLLPPSFHSENRHRCCRRRRLHHAAHYRGNKAPPFKISLAEWSLNKRIFQTRMPNRYDHLDFCKTARGLGIDGVEYVNQMFSTKATDAAYLAEMKKRQEAKA